jgi:hypothetical protein
VRLAEINDRANTNIVTDGRATISMEAEKKNDQDVEGNEKRRFTRFHPFIRIVTFPACLKVRISAHANPAGKI